MDDNLNQALNTDNGYADEPTYESPTEVNDEPLYETEEVPEELEEGESEEEDNGEESEDDVTESEEPVQKKGSWQHRVNKVRESVRNELSQEFSQRLQEEREQIRQQLLEDLKPKAPLTPEEQEAERQKQEARQKLRDLGFLTAEDVQAREQERMRAEEERKQNEEFLRSATEQEKTLNDRFTSVKGLPKIEATKEFKWAQENGIYTNNLEAIVKVRYFDKLQGFYNTPTAKVAPIAQQSASSKGAVLTPDMDTDQLMAAKGIRMPDGSISHDIEDLYRL